MSNPIRALCLVLACALWSAAAMSEQGSGAPIAGLEPDRRPQEAPRITTVVIEDATKSRRMYGVIQPWPGNLHRIAEQGTWYSPMFHPGMTGPYDLRHWHGARP